MTHEARRPHEDVVALERLLARIKQLRSLSVSLDGYDRWGRGSDPGFEASASRELAELPSVRKALDALLEELGERAPERITAWAEAHVAVLDDYIARVDADSTEAFVAKDEREKWREVAAGTRAYVRENPVYVKPNPAVYEAHFGFAPPALHW